MTNDAQFKIFFLVIINATLLNRAWSTAALAIDHDDHNDQQQSDNDSYYGYDGAQESDYSGGYKLGSINRSSQEHDRDKTDEYDNDKSSVYEKSTSNQTEPDSDVTDEKYKNYHLSSVSEEFAKEHSDDEEVKNFRIVVNNNVDPNRAPVPISSNDNAWEYAMEDEYKHQLESIINDNPVSDILTSMIVLTSRFKESIDKKIRQLYEEILESDLSNEEDDSNDDDYEQTKTVLEEKSSLTAYEFRQSDSPDKPTSQHNQRHHHHHHHRGERYEIKQHPVATMITNRVLSFFQ